MTGADWDVLIAGAGPAGIATALSLRMLAPELKIGVAGSVSGHSPCIDESAPRQIQDLLEHLGLWPAFLAEVRAPSFSSYSAWGTAHLEAKDVCAQAYKCGWHLDRARFNRWFVDAARQRGIAILDAKVQHVKRMGRAWQLGCKPLGNYSARYVVDATGRSAALLRMVGVTPRLYERLVGCAVFFAGAQTLDAPLYAKGTVVEAVKHGWWYSAARLDGQRVAAFMSDSDQVARLNAAKPTGWFGLLAQTRYIYTLLAKAQALGPPQLWSTGSSCTLSELPDGVLAAGDAMSAFDPLSSVGLVKALRSGIVASYALADALSGRDHGQGFARYSHLMQREFGVYQRAQQEHYRRVQHWPESHFWQRRHRDVPLQTGVA